MLRCHLSKELKGARHSSGDIWGRALQAQGTVRAVRGRWRGGTPRRLLWLEESELEVSRR